MNLRTAAKVFGWINFVFSIIAAIASSIAIYFSVTSDPSVFEDSNTPYLVQGLIMSLLYILFSALLILGALKVCISYIDLK